MQFLRISNDITLAQLADIVGDRNVDTILAANSLKRTPNIGKQFSEMCSKVIRETKAVDWQRQMTLLNTVTQHADIFEAVSALSQSGWKLFSSLGTLPNMLKIPESIVLSDSIDVLGSTETVSSVIYNKAMNCLKDSPQHSIDLSIFNEYNSNRNSQIVGDSTSSAYRNSTDSASSDPFQWFQIPWGKVSLYSSLGGDSKDFPVYPEELSDGRKANYTEMPDMLYQYEPWQVYQNSGPRSNTYTFKFHRDMWSGDHRDGKANELIRFCEANCYPEYNGSAVNTSIVTLYVGGKSHISGVMTDVSTRWSGPIGLDDWYLVCELDITITEISDSPLDYSTVRSKGLIG